MFKKAIEEKSTFLEIWLEKGVGETLIDRIPLVAKDTEDVDFTTQDTISLKFNGKIFPDIHLRRTHMPPAGEKNTEPNELSKTLVYRYTGARYSSDCSPE